MNQGYKHSNTTPLSTKNPFIGVDESKARYSGSNPLSSAPFMSKSSPSPPRKTKSKEAPGIKSALYIFKKKKLDSMLKKSM